MNTDVLTDLLGCVRFRMSYPRQIRLQGTVSTDKIYNEIWSFILNIFNETVYEASNCVICYSFLYTCENTDLPFAKYLIPCSCSFGKYLDIRWYSKLSSTVSCASYEENKVICNKKMQCSSTFIVVVLAYSSTYWY